VSERPALQQDPGAAAGVKEWLLRALELEPGDVDGSERVDGALEGALQLQQGHPGSLAVRQPGSQGGEPGRFLRLQLGLAAVRLLGAAQVRPPYVEAAH